MFGLSKRSAQNDPVQRFLELLLWMALNDGADKIVLGEPCDELPRVTCKQHGGLGPFLPPDMIKEIENTRNVPIWRRIGGKWYEQPGFSWFLLHDIVQRLCQMPIVQHPNQKQLDYSQSFEQVTQLKSERGEVKVLLRLTLEPNYCYSVTLKKVG
jgi:hypothetical protein